MIAWFRSLFPSSDKVSDHYRIGLSKAQHKDFDGAIQEYTAVLEASEVSSELCAMALYNRAIAYRFKKSYPAALADLDLLLSIEDAPPHVRKAAREKRVQMQKVVDGSPLT